VFAQMRRMIALPERLAHALLGHEYDFHLAVAGVRGDVETVSTRISAWLASLEA
jgi:hypothetical protein